MSYEGSLEKISLTSIEIALARENSSNLVSNST